MKATCWFNIKIEMVLVPADDIKADSRNSGFAEQLGGVVSMVGGKRHSQG